METKEQKAKEYADWLHKEIEEYYGRKCGPKDMSCKNGDIRVAFLDGWDAALKHLGEIPWDEAMNEICNHITNNSPEIPNSSKEEENNE